MRAVIIALLLTFASQAAAGCDNLCDKKWWRTATTADVQAELDAGADVMARDEKGYTPLHWATTPANIQALLAAGADVMARNKYGYTPLHRAAGWGATPQTFKPYWPLVQMSWRGMRMAAHRCTGLPLAALFLVAANLALSKLC